MHQTYFRCQEAFDRVGADVGVAESHGLLCGMLCARADFQPGQWLDEILDVGIIELPTVRDGRELLLDIVEETKRQLASEDLDFSPLLPDDEQTMSIRSRALADWCGGFLFGVGSAGGEVSAELSDDAREVLRDLGHVARRAWQEDESDESESAYAEVVEYLRVGVMLIHAELHTGRAHRPSPKNLH